MVCEASKILGLGQEISSHWGKTHNNLKLVFKMQPRLERVFIIVAFVTSRK